METINHAEYHDKPTTSIPQGKDLQWSGSRHNNDRMWGWGVEAVVVWAEAVEPLHWPLQPTLQLLLPPAMPLPLPLEPTLALLEPTSRRHLELERPLLLQVHFPPVDCCIPRTPQTSPTRPFAVSSLRQHPERSSHPRSPHTSDRWWIDWWHRPQLHMSPVHRRLDVGVPASLIGRRGCCCRHAIKK